MCNSMLEMNCWTWPGDHEAMNCILSYSDTRLSSIDFHFVTGSPLLLMKCFNVWGPLPLISNNQFASSMIKRLLTSFTVYSPIYILTVSKTQFAAFLVGMNRPRNLFFQGHFKARNFFLWLESSTFTQVQKSFASGEQSFALAWAINYLRGEIGSRNGTINDTITSAIGAIQQSLSFAAYAIKRSKNPERERWLTVLNRRGDPSAFCPQS